MGARASVVHLHVDVSHFLVEPGTHNPNQLVLRLDHGTSIAKAQAGSCTKDQQMSRP